MVASPVLSSPEKSVEQESVTKTVQEPSEQSLEQSGGDFATNSLEQFLSLPEWLIEPIDGTEWVNGQIIEKNYMGSKHGRIQAKLARYWGNYKDSSSQGGEVYTETPCRTNKQGRCPDVAYLTPELATQFEEFTALPQSFILIAEIVSPSDRAEDIFAKVKEYLDSGCEEIWLIFPDSQWIISITNEQQIFYRNGEEAKT